MARDRRKQVVTGAFGYSGRYIAQRLIADGVQVVTLTNSGGRTNPFGDQIEVHPLDFDRPDELVAAMKGASVLFNTYWVRFNHLDFSHRVAVENSFRLFDAAKRAGVERVVHVSITNPSLDSPFEYFRGKAQIEARLLDSGLSYAILRPAVLFGGEDILINNIAWTLRHLPIFGVMGDGQYRLQPTHVDDLARLAVTCGQNRENVIVNAVGPESFTFWQLVESIGVIIDCTRPMLSVPLELAYWVAWMIGKWLGDIFLTREEIGALMAGLLATDSPAAGTTSLLSWAKENRQTLGIRYASELGRRWNRTASYKELMGQQ